MPLKLLSIFLDLFKNKLDKSTLLRNIDKSKVVSKINKILKNFI